MSFKSNDTNNTINPGNYEEFFILYMDNELTAEQKAMVDAFLLAHPDLQSEFDLIKSLQLQPEAIAFNKESLMADQMKINLAEEDLLLYIDNELPAQRAKELEAQILSDKHLTLQHNILLQTKLDASEKIVYPNKAELYRREERTVRFGWMRVAAVIVVMATVGVVYFNSNNNGSTVSDVNGAGSIASKNATDKSTSTQSSTIAGEVIKGGKEKNTPVVDLTKDQQQNAPLAAKQKDKVKDQQVAPVQDVISNDDQFIAKNDTRDRSTAIDVNPVLTTASVTEISKDFINNSAVTSNVLPRTTINEAATPTIADENDDSDKVASNKGSLKGLLRKATRVIEKRTGIEAANEDDEILIGALAVKLK